MSGLVAPHGGILVNREAPPEALEDLRGYSKTLRALPLSPREASDLELIAVGAYSPLEGFMTGENYRAVVEDMRLAGGLPWTLPITLSTTREEAQGIREGQDLALVDSSGGPLALLHLEEKFLYDREREAQRVFQTTDPAHPGVQALLDQGEVLLGGKVTLLGGWGQCDFIEYRLRPAETRRLFQEKGWCRVAGFQTRNPVHRAHEYIQKCALEIVDGLFLHPLVGETKSDDIPASVRMKCYQVLLENYYSKGRAVLTVFPAAMRYAGPREAVFHSLVRKNYGCSHFIVGRDHAGVGSYYGPYEAQEIFDAFGPGELGLTPLFFDNTFYCHQCQGMASAKTCPHDPACHLILSGTQVRQMLRTGQALPPEFTRPEVARILTEAMRNGEGPE